jgi:hypothetical protein
VRSCNRPVIIMILHDIGPLRDIWDVECSQYCA